VEGVVMPVPSGALLKTGLHCVGWHLEDWDGLDAQIEGALALPTFSEGLRVSGHRHVLEHHTYHNRLQAVLEKVGLLP